MALFAHIVAGAVQQTRDMPTNFNASGIAHKGDWRPIVDQPDPTFNPLTQRLEGYTYVINPTDVERTKAVVALSTPEQNEAADADEIATLRTDIAAMTIVGASDQAKINRFIQLMFGA